MTQGLTNIWPTKTLLSSLTATLTPTHTTMVMGTMGIWPPKGPSTTLSFNNTADIFTADTFTIGVITAIFAALLA